MRVAGSVLMVFALLSGAVHGEEIRATLALESDPNLTPPEKVKVFSPHFKPLWGEALGRPEQDYQRIAAETIAQAHLFGFPGMTEFRPRLVEILREEKANPVTRFAAARTLITLDSRAAATELFEVSQKHSADLRQLVEPVLANWKYQPLVEVWRARLSSKTARHRDLMLAINGSARIGDQEAVPLLEKIALDPLRTAAARLEAAEAAGQLRDSGLDTDAAKLLANAKATQVDRICAVRLLARHSSESARTSLLKLAVDPQPAVAAAALGKLLELNPDLVIPLAEQSMQNADPIVRQRGAAAYAARPNPERAVYLVRLLDDPHPQVRGGVREDIYKLTKTPELDAVLRPAIMKMLLADGWRGQEQSILLFGALDHEPAAKRFVELLEVERDEVNVSAAWGLRKLAVADTLPAILDKAQRQTEARKNLKVGDNDLDRQVAHLFEAMGLMKYSPGEPLMRVHVPKSFEYGAYSRPAAVWALGYLYENQPNEELAKLLTERMEDVASIPPEAILVQMMSTVSLGRMMAKSQIEAIRKMLKYPTDPTDVNMSRRWALTKLTGEKLPDLVPHEFSKTNWFLVPLDGK